MDTDVRGKKTRISLILTNSSGGNRHIKFARLEETSMNSSTDEHGWEGKFLHEGTEGTETERFGDRKIGNTDDRKFAQAAETFVDSSTEQRSRNQVGFNHGLRAGVANTNFAGTELRQKDLQTEKWGITTENLRRLRKLCIEIRIYPGLPLLITEH